MANEETVYQELTEVFQDRFMRDDTALTPGLPAKQVQGWHSFRQIEILVASEEKWKIKFNTRELDSPLSVSNLAKTIVAKTWG